MAKKSTPAIEPIPENVRGVLEQQAKTIAELFGLVSRLQIKLDVMTHYLGSRGMGDAWLQNELNMRNAQRDPSLQLAVTSLLNAVRPAA